MSWKIIDQDGTTRETISGPVFDRMSKDRQREYANKQAENLTRFSGGKWRCKAKED